MTRDQISEYFKLGKKRNANRVLRNLSTYLSSFRDGYDTIYYLNNLGCIYVDCDKTRRVSSNVQHTIMRNDFWMFYNFPYDWKNEVKISDGQTNIVADSMFTRNGFKHFLEVDNIQKMKINQEKIKRYKTLSESLLLQFGYYPTIVWMTTTDLRRKNLEKACEGLKCKVYTIDDIK